MYILLIVGILLDLLFIHAEYDADYRRASIFKGLSSLMFVLLGFLFLHNAVTPLYGTLVVTGLVLGMLGDIFLELRLLFTGKKSDGIFAVGILAFLSGHFLYMAALLARDPGALLPGAGLALAVCLFTIPVSLKKIEAPGKGLQIFGAVYLVIVTTMFAMAAAVFVRSPGSSLNLMFAAGGLLFMFSDYLLIYFTFGKKKLPEYCRAVTLLSYYAAQLLIAFSLLGR